MLTTPSSTITIPATSLAASAHISASERATPLSPLANPDAVPTSPVVELTSTDVAFTPSALVTISITADQSAPSPEYLVLRHASGRPIAVPLPSESRGPARQSLPRPLTIPAAWLGLPGTTQLWLYQLVAGTNAPGLFTNRSSAVATPRLGDRYGLVLHGFDQDHTDIEPLRAAIDAIGWHQAVLTAQYDETQRPDAAADVILAMLRTTYPALFASSAELQLIGYSEGGVVTRFLAQKLRRAGSPLQVDTTHTIGSPHAGVPAAANVLASAVLTLSNHHGRRWLPTTPALRVLEKTDAPTGATPLLDQLAATPRDYAWTAIGGTRFPENRPSSDLVALVLGWFGALLYERVPNDGIVAHWSSMPTPPVADTATYSSIAADRHHLNLIDPDYLARLCQAVTSPYGAGGSRISHGSLWSLPDGSCYVERGQPSSYGRYVVYESDQTNNIASDTNGRRDIFLFDQVTGDTELVSVLSDGSQLNGTSRRATVSIDGRYVLFASKNTRSLTGETLGHWNVYLRDRQLRVTSCLTTNQFGTELHPDDAGGSDRLPLGLTMTPDARVVVYAAVVDQTGYSHIVHFNRTTGIRQLVDVANGLALARSYSSHPTVSDNGMRVCFQTLADNLGGGYALGEPFPIEKIYVRDLAAQTTRAVSVRPDGRGGADICELAMISGDGSAVVYSGRDPLLSATPLPANSWSIFVHRLDQPTATATSVVSFNEAGTILPGYSNYPSVDRAGRYVGFVYLHDNPFGTLGDVVLVDLANRRSRSLTMNLAGQPSNGLCYWPTLSADGGVLHFASYATSFDPSNVSGIVQDYVVTNPLLLPPGMIVQQAQGNPGSLVWRTAPLAAPTIDHRAGLWDR